jgi:peroxiredoxin
MLRLIFAVLITVFALRTAAQELPQLAIGAAAPDFSLPATDGKTYRMADFKKAKVLVVAFTCNHCPTAQAYEDRLIALSRDYAPKGVQLIAISPNAPEAVRLDECSYSDMGDTFDDMKVRAKDKGYNFPYLYDGATQAVAKAYGAAATPHMFIFDATRRLQYRGRFDDTEKPGIPPKTNDALAAVDALLAGKPVPTAETKTFGCSIKWKEKTEWVKAGWIEWAKEPVSLRPMNADSLALLLQNKTDKLRLINVWATWCGPCVAEFPALVDLHRTYRVRDFELVTITTDRPEQRAKALKFLQGKQASNTNYILDGLSVYQFIEQIAPKWSGALPYTLLIAPGGERVYAVQGALNMLALRKKIVDHPLLGRYY